MRRLLLWTWLVCSGLAPASEIRAQSAATRARASVRGTPAWTVEPKPLLSISMNDTLNFSLFAGLTRLPDGGVVVASDAKNNMQFFDARGRLTKSVGRTGRGPGEFDGIWSMGRTGDTLVILDRTNIAHLFSLTGSYLRSDPVIASPANLYGYQRDGSRVTGVLDNSNAESGEWKQAVETIQRRRGAVVTKLGDFPTLELTRGVNGRPRAHLYAPRNRVAVLREHVCAGYAGGVSISCFDMQGRKVGTVTLTNVTAVPVTKADEEAYFTDIYEANIGDSKEKLDGQVRLERERRTFAKSMGYFGSLIASRDDDLWVGPPSTADGRPFVTNVVPSAPTTWRVFRPDGTPVATVSLPARFRLVEAGSDYAAGITTDADDLEVVVIYRLRKR